MNDGMITTQPCGKNPYFGTEQNRHANVGIFPHG